MRAVVAFAMALSPCAEAAELKAARTLSLTETRIAIEALLKTPEAPLSRDPSCKSDLNSPGDMSIGQGVGVALMRAATDQKPVTIKASCFVRTGYPIGPGQEYCRLAFTSGGRQAQGYGLVFVMDWSNRTVAPGTVECY